MNPVLKSRAGREMLTRERCHIRERLNDSAVPDVSLADCRVETGVQTERHRLSVDECLVIIGGEGLVEVGDDLPARVAAGDVVVIPAGSAQRILNTGTGDLRFQCICRPRFTPACYEPLE